MTQEAFQKLNDKINVLKSQIRIKDEEIKIKQTERNALSKELFDLEWPVITWDELEKYLKDNPQDRYELNPEVTNGHHSTYCRILTEGEHAGEMQVGPYFHHDNFPRGKNLRVSYDFKQYRNIGI